MAKSAHINKTLDDITDVAIDVVRNIWYSCLRFLEFIIVPELYTWND